MGAVTAEILDGKATAATIRGELKARCDVVELDGPTDYRRLKFEGEEVYHFGTGPEVDAEMDRLWLRLTGGIAGEAGELHSLGRSSSSPKTATTAPLPCIP